MEATMPAPVKVDKFQVKSHAEPDEVRSPDKTRVEVVKFEGYSIGRLTFQPGWRWSECVKPVVKTDSCQLSHVGHAIAGKLKVRMQDGTEKMINAGESYTIPPGHDAWVEGDKAFVGLEVLSAEQYAKR